MWKNLSISGLGISGRQSEVIELALSFGFQGIDLDITEFAEYVEQYGLPHARRLIDSARIRIGTFRLPVVWQEWDVDEATYCKGMEKLPDVARLAADLGCSRCLTSVTPACDERPYHENFEFHRKRLMEIADLFEPYGIRVGIEFLAPLGLRKGFAFQFIHSLDALVALAKASGAANVGVAIDLWQMHVAGSSLDEIKDLSGQRIVAVHVSDIAPDANLDQVDETSRLMPGETGAIDGAGALTRLAELGYDGPVALKASSPSGTNREATVRKAAERLDALWKAAGLSSHKKAAAPARG